MKKMIIKRLLALLLSCSIVVGSVAASSQKAYAMGAAGAIAGTGAVVGSETAFAYLLGIMGFTAASAAVYENRDAIASWGKTQISKFKAWAKEKKDELTAWAGSTATDIEATIDAWGTKLSAGTLSKTDGTWDAVKKWVQDDVYKPASSDRPMYNGYPIGAIGQNMRISSGTYWSDKGLTGTPDVTNYVCFFFCYVNSYGEPNKIYGVVSTEKGYSYNSNGSKSVVCGDYSLLMDGKYYFYWVGDVPDKFDYTGFFNCIENKDNELNNKKYMPAVREAATWLATGVVPGLGTDDDRDYVYTGGLAGVLDGAGVIDNTDVVGTGSKEDEEKSTTLPWPADNSLDQVLGGVSAGEKTWSDVLDTVGAGVIDRTDAGDMVIDDDGVTEKEWTYSPAIPTTPDITLPDTPEASKELKDYTLAGLEKLFPFCLPFDLIDFIKVLDAQPEAPCFTIPFMYPTKDGLAKYDITIDLSQFDSVASLLRDMECLLFIVGLIMITRSKMIRG